MIKTIFFIQSYEANKNIFEKKYHKSESELHSVIHKTLIRDVLCALMKFEAFRPMT